MGFVLPKISCHFKSVGIKCIIWNIYIQLQKLAAYKKIDGLEPAAQMLNRGLQNGHYGKGYCQFFGLDSGIDKGMLFLSSFPTKFFVPFASFRHPSQNNMCYLIISSHSIQFLQSTHYCFKLVVNSIMCSTLTQLTYKYPIINVELYLLGHDNNVPTV